MSYMSTLMNDASSREQTELRKRNIRGSWSCLLCHYINNSYFCYNCGRLWETPNKRFLPDGEDNQKDYVPSERVFLYMDPIYSRGKCIGNNNRLYTLDGEDYNIDSGK